MKHNKTKDELLVDFIREKHNKGVVVGGRAGLLITLAILWDCFDFTKEDMNKFCEKYEELFHSYDAGDENPADWYSGLIEQTGIDIQHFLEQMK